MMLLPCRISPAVRACGSNSAPRLAASTTTTTTPRHQRRRLCCRANPDDDEAAPVPLGDWRAFRAKLVSTGVVSTEDIDASVSSGSGDGSDPSNDASGSASAASSSSSSSRPRPAAASRPSLDNQRLLRVQNPRLADEDSWAHRLAQPERGCLLIASHDAPRLLGSEAWWQAVVLVVDITPAGSVGLLLNRPTAMALARRPGGLPFEIAGAPTGMQDAFGDCRVYRGGPVAQQVLHLLHGHRIDGAQQLVPGVFLGGERDATARVGKGELDPAAFKFFAGATLWEAGALERECAKGAWIPVAAARPLILKQVLQLPTPLWRELLDLLGDDEALREVRQAYSEDGPDE
jgi:putative transcriptional regulator